MLTVFTLRLNSLALFADSAGADPEAAPIFPAGFAVAFPYAAEMALAVTHGGALGSCDDDVEFESGLDFILDGLGRLRRPPQASQALRCAEAAADLACRRLYPGRS